MVSLPLFLVVVLANVLASKSESASTFAGSPTSAVFPPPNVSVTAGDTYFPEPTQVGYAGPTPTGDEAAAIATAPAAAKVQFVFPLLKPNASDATNKNFDVTKYWGNLTPFSSVDSFGLPDASPQIPDQCEIKQVFLLHRHGARYPTSGSAPDQFAAGVHQIASGPGFSASGPLKFLNTWKYKLGAEILTPFGRDELFNLGVGFRVKYGHLLSGFKDLPVWRTTSQERMVDSAVHFAAGFFGVQSYKESYHQLVTIEEAGFNNTLVSSLVCPNSDAPVAYGLAQANKWAANYTVPAVQRLSPYLEGVQLNASHIVAMQSLCAYETVALGYSVFCDLFTAEEWAGFEYYLDLVFWYGFGPGSPTNAALGVGYVQELVSRLTKTRITDFNTSVNSTVVSNNVTFPLDQPIFVDASHDTTITAIFTAMNFTSLTVDGPLPVDHIPVNQTYVVSKISPFATNLVGQVLSCGTDSKSDSIRWILNDAVLPLTGIQGCEEDADGRCALDTFVSGMQQRIAEIDFQYDCYANYTIPDPDTITVGQPPIENRNL